MAFKPLHGAALLAVALALAAPSPAAAQSSDPPACPDRSAQIPDPKARVKATAAADWAMANLVRPSGAIWNKRTGPNLGYGADLSMAFFDLGGTYCVAVGKWLQWHFDHLNLEGSPDPSSPDYNEHYGAVGTWKESESGVAESLNPRGYDNVNAALLTVARMYQARATGGAAWINSNGRLQKLVEAGRYLDRLYQPFSETTGLTRLTTGGTGDGGNAAKFFQDNVTTWAGYRDYAQMLAQYGSAVLDPLNVTAAFYDDRAADIRRAMEQHLYNWNDPLFPGREHLYRIAYNDDPHPFSCWYKGAYTQVFGLWYGVWGPYSPLPESNARRGAFFTRFMKPDAQLGWAIGDTREAAGCNWPDTTGVKSQPAFAAVKAATQEPEFSGGPQHEASAIVWESNLPIPPNTTNPELMFEDPVWSAFPLAGYIRYQAIVRPHALQDDNAASGGFFKSGVWYDEPIAVTDPVDDRVDIHAGPSRVEASPSDYSEFVSVKFAPDVPQRGLYSVRLVYHREDWRSKNVPVLIQSLAPDGSVTQDQIPVDQSVPMADGTTQKVETATRKSFCFKAGRYPASDTGQWVSVHNGSGPRNMSADAVVLQRVGDC